MGRLPPRMGRMAGALGLGAAGGYLFSLLDLPLAWMIGAMTATTVASLAGLRISIADRVRSPMIAALGIMLGSSFTPGLLEGVLLWLPSLAVLPAYVLLVGGLIYVYLRRVAGFERATAYFAATPGGLSEMVILGDRMGGDLRDIALVHAVRILLIVLTVPFLARRFDAAADPAVPAAGLLLPMSAGELGLVLALGVLGYGLARLVRLPAPVLIGPMLGSAGAYMTGVADSPPPPPLLALAQLVIGASVGCRFSGMPLRRVLRTIVLGIGSTLIMLLVTAAFGYGLHLATGRPLLALALAYIPGGLPEMSLTALALGVDPAFVTTHHIARIALVVVLAPLCHAGLQRLLAARGATPPAG